MRTPAPHRLRRLPALGMLCASALACGFSGCATSVPAPARADAPAVDTAAATPVARRDAHDATVARLRSDDFGTRTRAARALVASGEAALPALGRAGPSNVVVAGGVTVSTTRAVVDAIFAQVPDENLEGHLVARWPGVRRGAAAELGRRDGWHAIPRLIERLDDPDAGVRAASGASLRRLTNNFFGYRAQASLGQRREAAGRWRSWWSREGRARAAERRRGPLALRGSE